jgi:hypothetical protein
MKNVVILLFLVSLSANAQSRIPFLAVSQSKHELTGSLSQDLFAAQPESLSHQDSLFMLETRSSLKAGVFSLLIPGAGQIYNGGTGNYIKAAGFLAVEAAAIAVNIIWTNKAKDKTTYFQNYADGTASEWSSYGQNGYQPNNPQVHYYNVYKYAQWIYGNISALENQNGTSDAGKNVISQNIGELFHTLTHQQGAAFDPTQAPWTQVNWKALNNIEFAMGGYFSHVLPPHGDQQYYELIGKYPEFRQGWNDENPSYLRASDLNNTTNLSSYYMGQRGEANNLYGVAGTAIGVIIANHFVSAIEAAIWAHGHNKIVQTTVGVSPIPLQGIVAYQTQVNVAVNF